MPNYKVYRVIAYAMRVGVWNWRIYSMLRISAACVNAHLTHWELKALSYCIFRGDLYFIT